MVQCQRDVRFTRFTVLRLTLQSCGVFVCSSHSLTRVLSDLLLTPCWVLFAFVAVQPVPDPPLDVCCEDWRQARAKLRRGAVEHVQERTAGKQSLSHVKPLKGLINYTGMLVRVYTSVFTQINTLGLAPSRHGT